MASFEDDDDFVCTPNQSTIELVYEMTLPGSAARRLLVDLEISRGASEMSDDIDVVEFLQDMAKAFRAIAQGKQSQNPVKFRFKTLFAESYFV